ncbi:MAG: hypothetical protein ACQEXI_13220 [Pseudomonadota bacterium]
MKLIVIASSPRVGSSLLSDILTQAGVGYVAEHFNLSHQVPILAREKNLKSLNDHFNYITSNFTNSTQSIFTVKCHFDQYFNYSKNIDVLSHFSSHHFIHLKRIEKTDQAISYFIAKATNAWSSKNMGNKTALLDKLYHELKKMPGEELYNHIVAMSFRLQQNESYWEFYLKDLAHDVLFYENLFTPEGSGDASRLLSGIYGEKISFTPKNSTLNVQRDIKISSLIKDKISPFIGKPPKVKLIDSCLSFNNSFFGYTKNQ